MIVSIHRYELAESTTDREFRDAVREAERRELFDLPGLVEYRFLRGIRGDRDGEFAALWRYGSREAWRDLWGPVGDPVETHEYPETWRIWEEELLAPLVRGNPDEIEFTAYEVLDGGTGE